MDISGRSRISQMGALILLFFPILPESSMKMKKQLDRECARVPGDLSPPDPPMDIRIRLFTEGT